jgi:hypothetical protein
MKLGYQLPSVLGLSVRREVDDSGFLWVWAERYYSHFLGVAVGAGHWKDPIWESDVGIVSAAVRERS